MLKDFTGADHIYIACGYTDMRKGIDGLAASVRSVFGVSPFSNSLFLFCGRRNDRIKALYYGSSSEKTPCKDQLLLFDESEDIKAAVPFPTPDENGAVRRNTRKGTRNEQSLQKAIDSLPVSDTYKRELKESERVCPHCGGQRRFHLEWEMEQQP